MAMKVTLSWMLLTSALLTVSCFALSATAMKQQQQQQPAAADGDGIEAHHRIPPPQVYSYTAPFLHRAPPLYDVEAIPSNGDQYPAAMNMENVGRDADEDLFIPTSSVGQLQPPATYEKRLRSSALYPTGWDKRAQTFVRFGKRAQTFVRFGKRAQTFVRFG